MKKQVLQWLTMGLFAVTAMIWTIRSVILLTTSRCHGPSETDVLLSVLCAGVWWLALIVQVIRYHKGKKGGS